MGNLHDSKFFPNAKLMGAVPHIPASFIRDPYTFLQRATGRGRPLARATMNLRPSGMTEL
jgi:hypothetical protein